jgi:hypothetical protein
MSLHMTTARAALKATPGLLPLDECTNNDALSSLLLSQRTCAPDGLSHFTRLSYLKLSWETLSSPVSERVHGAIGPLYGSIRTSVDYNMSADTKVGEPKPETSMLGVQVIEVNAEELEVALAEREKPMVIDFYADCSHVCL